MKAVVLGSTGMLGAKVSEELRGRVPTLELPRIASPTIFDTSSNLLDFLRNLKLSQDHLLVNCIGWIPQRASGDQAKDSVDAFEANVMVPAVLEEIQNEKSS